MYVSNENHRICFLFNSSAIATIWYVCIFANALNQCKQELIQLGNQAKANWLWTRFLLSIVCARFVGIYSEKKTHFTFTFISLVPSLQKQTKHPFIECNSDWKCVGIPLHGFRCCCNDRFFLHHSPLNFTPHLNVCSAHTFLGGSQTKQAHMLVCQ